MKQISQRVIPFLVAVIATAAVASVVQTQINLAQLVELGAPVAVSLRALTTLEDLARFGPVMAAITAAALLPALLVGHQAARVASSAWRMVVFAVVAVGGLWLAFWLMRSVIPMPAIAATRSLLGHTLMSLTGIVGGLLYAAMTSPRAQQSRRAAGTRGHWRRLWTGLALVLVPAILFIIMAPGAGDRPAPGDPGGYRVQTIATGLNRPWSVAFLPDGRALVTEMSGRLLAIAADGSSSAVALDGLPPIFHQRGVIGLMEVALDPAFEQSGLIYLTMGYGGPGANGTRLVRAKLVGDRIEDVRVLFSSTLKSRAGNNGGRIAFLGDGTLVLTLGDGGSRREDAQNIDNHLGTLVRIDRAGQPPADNPFHGRPGAAPEIYSLGHRNAQGIAYDPATDELLVTEHGPRGGDEINRIVPGGNYGWPVVTGGIDYPFGRVSPFRHLAGYREAMLEWTPSIAPAGLAVYDGALFADWQGDLLVPALKERTLRRVLRDGGRIVGQQLLLAEMGERMRDVKVAPDGSIYVLTDGIDARLLRLVPPSPNG
ncbi:PQQ-dependent sugar dehydrogenase [Halotalea alkalilenta]|uniref:PQQ-dependent sugar dehydrogenase n=1 Tax=Halotalea alkalilenta TaxID=376489 RepID=UPI000481C834|nr:PQQ-dependent sugar dehydrogenase [Halotalea alkalilenta]